MTDFTKEMTDTVSQIRDVIGDRLFEARIKGESPNQRVWHRCYECDGSAEMWKDIHHTRFLGCKTADLIDMVLAFEALHDQ